MSKSTHFDKRRYNLSRDLKQHSIYVVRTVSKEDEKFDNKTISHLPYWEPDDSRHPCRRSIHSVISASVYNATEMVSSNVAQLSPVVATGKRKKSMMGKTSIPLRLSAISMREFPART